MLNDMGKWLTITTLLGLLALALWAAYEQWMRIIVSIPAWGWALMAFGGGLSIVVGVGLMALVFYSSRMGYDEPPRVVEPGGELSPSPRALQTGARQPDWPKVQRELVRS
jgi:MFS superfamily sulfate permease-like transporter